MSGNLRRWSDKGDTVPSYHSRMEARKDVAERVNASNVEDGDVVREAIRQKRPFGLLLIIGSLTVALLVGGALFLRSHQTAANDTALCEKLDRLVVKIEVANANNPNLSPAERKKQQDFWEAFRNDPPVCRTAGP